MLGTVLYLFNLIFFFLKTLFFLCLIFHDHSLLIQKKIWYSNTTIKHILCTPVLLAVDNNIYNYTDIIYDIE